MKEYFYLDLLKKVNRQSLELLSSQKVMLFLKSCLVVPAVSEITEAKSATSNSYSLTFIYFFCQCPFFIPWPFKSLSCVWESTIHLTYFYIPLITPQLAIRKLFKYKQKNDYNATLSRGICVLQCFPQNKMPPKPKEWMSHGTMLGLQGGSQMVDFVICNTAVDLDWVTSSSAVQRGDMICSKSAIQCVQNRNNDQQQKIYFCEFFSQ